MSGFERAIPWATLQGETLWHYGLLAYEEVATTCFFGVAYRVP